jgi:hypothetical protein
MLLRYEHQNLVIPNLVSTNRYLLYHSDLILLSPVLFDHQNQKKIRKSDLNSSNNQNIQNQNSIHHLILFSDILIVTIKTL